MISLTLTVVSALAQVYPFEDGVASPTRVASTLLVEALDVNGDPHTDLVCAGPGGVEVLLGDGAGRFAPSNSSSPFGTPDVFILSVADLDADGDLDILIGDFNGSLLGMAPVLRTFLADGMSNFVPGPTQVVPDLFSASVAHLDGDAVPDLVLTDRNNPLLFIQRGDGLGGFQPMGTIPSRAWAHQFARDLTGDGIIDVLADSAVVGEILLHAGLGDGTFLPAVPTGILLPVNPGALRSATLAFGDANGDGLDDVLTGGTQLALQTAVLPAVFSTPVVLSSSAASAQRLVDLEGDGFAEAAGVSQEGLVLRAGTPGGPAPARQSIFAAGYGMTVAEVTGDGIQDIIVANSSWIVVYPSERGLPGQVRAPRAFELAEGGYYPVVADLNGDGREDIVTGRGGVTLTALGDGAGGFTLPVQPAPGAFPTSTQFALGNFDGDSFLDSAVRLGNGLVSLRNGIGDGTFSTGTIIPGVQSFSRLEILAANIDGDAHDELLLIENGGPLSVADSTPTGGLQLISQQGHFVGLGGAAVGDVDGDGDEDLVIASSPTSFALSVLLASPAGMGTPLVTPAPTLPASTGLALTDLDGDGNLDAVTCHEDGLVAVFLGDGAGRFAAPRTFAAGDNLLHVLEGDFDQDGHPDVAVQGADGFVTVLRGAGDGTLLPGGSHLLAPPGPTGPSTAHSLVALDADGDGLEELISLYRGATNGAQVVVLENSARYQPVTFCDALPSSLGVPARVSWLGFTSVRENRLTLRAGPLPSPTIGLFFYGLDAPATAFGNGTRCVGEPLYRLPLLAVGPGMDGFEYTLDFAALPSGPLLVGSTWSFQAWYQDAAAGAQAFNVSEGLRVLFGP